MEKNIPVIVHIGILVKDLDKAIDFFTTLPGARFTEIYETHFKREFIDGVEIPAGSIRIGKVYIGNVGLEIISPLKGESFQKQFIERRGEGFHHIALLYPGETDSVDKAFLDKGFKRIWSTELVNGRVAHYHGIDAWDGPVVELLNSWPSTWPNPETEN